MERKAWKSNSGENEEMDSNLGVQHLTNFITHNHRIEEKDSDDFSLETTALKRRINSEVSNLGSTEEEAEVLNPSQSLLVTIYDLPNEIIDKILRKLTNKRDILNSRLVNFQWKEFSSLIWSRRRNKDMVIRFSNFKGRFLCNDFGSKSLDDFRHSFDGDKLPYTHFDFGDLSHFGNDDIVTFLSTRGKEILGVTISMLDPVNSIQTLRKLLKEQVPNLKEFNVQIHSQKSTSIQLFARSKAFQLPKLEILVVDENLTKFYKMSKQILTAACNLKRVDLSHNITADDFKVFQSLKKLHLLKKIKIYISRGLIHWLKPSIISNLKLQTLYLSFESMSPRLGVSSVVNQLLESSKDVIEILTLQPVDLTFVFPTLKKLQKLELRKSPFTNSSSAMFPEQIIMADVFPNLMELDIHFDNFPSTAQLVPMPSVKILRIYGHSNPASRENLTKMTPNVTCIHLNDYYPSEIYSTNEEFIDGFRIILNNLTKLETFQWTITQFTHYELFFSLDAAVSGLTKTFCRQISKKLRTKDNFSASELASIERERIHSSILDLKELKTLNIALQFRKSGYDSYSKYNTCRKEDAWWHEGRLTETSKFYRTGFTKISQLLAFDHMPGVEICIKRVVD